MKITVPINEKWFGEDATCFDAFKYMQTWLLVLTKNFHKKYSFGVVPDIEGMEANYIVNIIKHFSTLYQLCAVTPDFAAAAVLCRSIADRIAILKLVFGNADKLEREYRFYLYIMDGIKTRHEMLEKRIEKNDNISSDEYDALVKQMTDAKANADDVLKFCIDRLNRHEYATLYPKFHSKVIDKTAWNYKEVGCLGSKGGVSVYKWEDMYTLLDSRDEIKSLYSDYLSQFVHGLSLSLLPQNDCKDNFNSLLSVGVCLQGEVLNELKTEFNNNNSLLKDISDYDLTLIMSQIDADYRKGLIHEFKSRFQKSVNDSDKACRSASNHSS